MSFRWARGCVVEVGVWVVSLSCACDCVTQMFYLGGNGNGRSLQEVKHPVTESLGWKSFKGKCSTRWECGCVNEVGVWVLWPRWECGCANQWGV